MEHLEGNLRHADDALARAVVRAIVESPILDDFLARIAAYDRAHPEVRQGSSPIAIPQQEVRDRIGEIPVAILGRRARAALKRPPGAEFTPSRIVRLSPDTALKQLKHSDPGHKGPLTNDDYRRLPEIIEHGRVVATADRTLEFFHKVNGSTYRAVVKETRDDRMYLVTFHRAARRHLKGALKRERRRRK